MSVPHRGMWDDSDDHKAFTLTFELYIFYTAGQDMWDAGEALLVEGKQD